MSDIGKVTEGAVKAYELLQLTTDLQLDLWTEHVVFSWRWWLLAILTIAPWIIWWKLRKKESTHRLLLVGFFVMFLSVWMDNLGAKLGWWYYTYEVLPITPAYKPWDISLMPVFIMFFLQYKPYISPLIKAGIYALIVSFGAEPFFMWLGYFKYPNWEYIYSYFIYYAIYLIAHFFSTRDKFAQL